ncbi:MAG: TonB-dependent receptor, partial [Chitinophagaceae bacterium]
MKKICLAAIALLLSHILWAQGNVSGKLMDTDSKKPLYLSTVTIYRAADTSIVTYRLSDKDGGFKVPGLPLNTPLRALVSFSGYEVMRKDFSLSETNNSLDLDTLW